MDDYCPTGIAYDSMSREFNNSLIKYTQDKSEKLNRLCKIMKKRLNNGFKNLSLQEQEEELRKIRPEIDCILGLDMEDCKHRGMAYELAKEAFERLKSKKN